MRKAYFEIFWIMILLTDKPGQLGNRLWAFTPFISFALSRKKKIFIIFFNDYMELFENLKIYTNVVFLDKKHIIYRIFSYAGFLASFFNVLNKIIVLFYRKDYFKYLQKSRFIALRSRKYPKPDMKFLYEQHSKIKILFQPANRNVSKVDSVFYKKRKEFDVIIGLHIRRGDYKDFKNGNYFYDDDTYINIINQLSNIHKGKNIGFFICSDSPVKVEKYRLYNVFMLKVPSIIEDLYALSKCDYIVGAPSTYSMWASFYGKVPLYQIREKHPKVNFKDFSVVVEQNKFENGNVRVH